MPKSEIDGVLDRIKAVNFRKVVNRPQTPLDSDVLHIGYVSERQFTKMIGKPFRGKSYVCTLGSDLYYDADDLDKLGAILNAKTEKDAEFPVKLIGAAERLGAKLNATSKRLRQTDFDGYTTPRLVALFKRLIAQYEPFGAYLLVPISIERSLQSKLEASVAERLGDKERAKGLVVKLIRPFKENLPQMERRDLLKLAMLQKRGRDITRLAKAHAAEYGQMGKRWGIGEVFTYRDIMARAADMEHPDAELAKMDADEKEVAMEFRETMKGLGNDAELKKLALLAKEYAWFRTFRSDTISGFYASIYELVSEIGRRHGLERDDGNYLLLSEILDERFPSKKEISARRTGFVFLILDGRSSIFTGREAKLITSYFDSLQKIAKEVKGTVANRPVAKIGGIARIVLNASHISRVKKGEIMVSQMTEPHYITAMERASAFVTDEGGILCHAAIVSREMGKPCIIGTGNATKVIKDGDRIELNLETGDVRVL